MKAIITWVVVANAHSARIVENTGLGKGFADVPGQQLKADPPSEYADAPVQGHSSHGVGRAMKTRRDPKSLAACAFADRIAAELANGHRRDAFSRLVLVAGPHMLGELRDALDDIVGACIVADLDKDLTDIPLADLPRHLAHIVAA